jgi:hypothetical protein
MGEPELQRLRDRLIERAVEQVPGCEEGRVSTTGPLPYRRLDACGVALAYLHVRAGRRALRVDVTGRWPVRPDGAHAVPWSAGAASFWVRSEKDAEKVCRALARAVRAAPSPRAA